MSSNVYFVKDVRHVLTWAEWRSLVFGPQRTHNVSEEVSCNTPTILLQWILPVKEIWNSDTHIQCVCDGGQYHIYKQYCFITHFSDVNTRKGKKERKKEREERTYSTLFFKEQSLTQNWTRMNTDSNCASTSKSWSFSSTELHRCERLGSKRSAWWWRLLYKTTQFIIMIEATTQHILFIRLPFRGEAVLTSFWIPMT